MMQLATFPRSDRFGGTAGLAGAEVESGDWAGITRSSGIGALFFRWGASAMPLGGASLPGSKGSANPHPQRRREEPPRRRGRSGTRPDGVGGGSGPAVGSRVLHVSGASAAEGPAESWPGQVGWVGAGSAIAHLPGCRGWQRSLRWYSSADPDCNGKGPPAG
jgi:hypothetical protein